MSYRHCRRPRECPGAYEEWIVKMNRLYRAWFTVIRAVANVEISWSDRRGSYLYKQDDGAGNSPWLTLD
jgi:hypothetical protein